MRADTKAVRNKSTEKLRNSPKTNIEFSTDFKADFVGFSQKPYRVGFFAYIDTFLMSGGQ